MKVTPDVVERTFLQVAMFKMGVVPIEDPSFDYRRILKQLPPEEARKLKRKFRKLWRKLLSKKDAARAGLGKRVPDRFQRHYRKQLVWQEVMKKHVRPAIERFNNPSSDKA